MTGCKESACTSCMHREVCRFSPEFLKAQEAVANVMVGLGDRSIKRLCDFDYINPVELKCKYWKLTNLGGGIR